ncbi:MAG: hypothetical protein PHE02_04145 [Lachnospiraceae bacterium]|nr:hypothetical protein [Lachnospiraceae bacterium]
MLTRMEMKQRAKDAMKNASTHPVLVFLVYLVITLAMTGIINFITQSIMVGISLGSSMADSNAVSIGAALMMVPVSLILSLIPFAITSILATGLTAYYLKTIRHQ